MLWRYATGKPISTSLSAEAVQTLAFSPHSDGLAAVGYHSGVVVVLAVGRDSLAATHRLRGHTQEIHSLSWSPGRPCHRVACS